MVDCKLPHSKEPVVVQQKGDLPECVIMARSFHASGDTAKVCIMNIGNSPVVLRAGMSIGKASEGTELQAECPEDEVSIRRVSNQVGPLRTAGARTASNDQSGRTYARRVASTLA